MARLNASEFEDLIGCLADELGVAKLQERLVRANALVSRRHSGSIGALARQLYQLTVGLEKDGVPSRVLMALWEEKLAAGSDEKTSEQLEEIAKSVNGCLDDGGHLLAGREDELRGALVSYREVLAGKVGERVAVLTMLLRAYPDVARILRAGLEAEATAPGTSSEDEGAGNPDRRGEPPVT